MYNSFSQHCFVWIFTWMCQGSWWRGQTCRGGGPRGRSGGWSQPRGGRTRSARAGWRWRDSPWGKNVHVHRFEWYSPREGNQIKCSQCVLNRVQIPRTASFPMGFYFNHQWKRKLMMENDQPKLHTRMNVSPIVNKNSFAMDILDVLCNIGIALSSLLWDRSVILAHNSHSQTVITRRLYTRPDVQWIINYTQDNG